MWTHVWINVNPCVNACVNACECICERVNHIRAYRNPSSMKYSLHAMFTHVVFSVLHGLFGASQSTLREVQAVIQSSGNQIFSQDNQIFSRGFLSVWYRSRMFRSFGRNDTTIQESPDNKRRRTPLRCLLSLSKLRFLQSRPRLRSQKPDRETGLLRNVTQKRDSETIDEHDIYNIRSIALLLFKLDNIFSDMSASMSGNRRLNLSPPTTDPALSGGLFFGAVHLFCCSGPWGRTFCALVWWYQYNIAVYFSGHLWKIVLTAILDRYIPYRRDFENPRIPMNPLDDACHEAWFRSKTC